MQIMKSSEIMKSYLHIRNVVKQQHHFDPPSTSTHEDIVVQNVCTRKLVGSHGNKWYKPSLNVNPKATIIEWLISFAPNKVLQAAPPAISENKSCREPPVPR